MPGTKSSTEDLLTKTELLLKLLSRKHELIHLTATSLKQPIENLRHGISTTQKAEVAGRITGEELCHRLMKAEIQCAHLTNLIGDLVDLSADGHTSQIEIHLQETNLSHIAANVLERYLDKAVTKKCNLVLDCPRAVVGQWDADRLDRVLSHLVSFFIEHAHRSIIEMKISSNEKVATIVVTDKGPNITSSEPSHDGYHFSEFEESDISGFRLWYVKTIVERFDGSTTMSICPNSKATFSIELPLGDKLH